MGNILIDKEKFQEYAFENESEFEKAVIENSKFLFGKDSVYIDVKRRLGKGYKKGVPDGYVIDFTDSVSPQLYIIENELASHDIYGHISEQIARFGTIIATSKNSIRDMLIKEIKGDNVLNQEILNKLNKSSFDNLDQLMINLVEKTNIKIAIVIDDIEEELELVLENFKNKPDALLLQRYIKDNKTAYFCEPLIQEIQEDVRTVMEDADTREFDTVVCAAFEEGFKNAYLEKNAWWAIRLSQRAREKLKYLAIYEKSPTGAVQNIAEIEKIMSLVKSRLGTSDQYAHLGYNIPTEDINEGPKITAYKLYETMDEKFEAQLNLAKLIKPVNAKNVAEKVLTTHFNPDILGNLRKISVQSFRCGKCNEKFRRPPLTNGGKCPKCGNKVLLTVNRGGIEKYIPRAIRLVADFMLDDYTKQRMELIEEYVESLTNNPRIKQHKLSDFF